MRPIPLPFTTLVIHHWPTLLRQMTRQENRAIASEYRALRREFTRREDWTALQILNEYERTGREIQARLDAYEKDAR